MSFLSPRNLPDPGIESGSPVLQTDSLLSEPPGKPYRQDSIKKKKRYKMILTRKKYIYLKQELEQRKWGKLLIKHLQTHL